MPSRHIFYGNSTIEKQFWCRYYSCCIFSIRSIFFDTLNNLAVLIKWTKENENCISYETQVSLYQCTIHIFVMITGAHFYLTNFNKKPEFSSYRSISETMVINLLNTLFLLAVNSAFPSLWPAIKEVGGIKKDRRISITAGIFPRKVRREMNTVNSWIEKYKTGELHI